jgi:hypothetical protein
MGICSRMDQKINKSVNNSVVVKQPLMRISDKTFVLHILWQSRGIEEFWKSYYILATMI